MSYTYRYLPVGLVSYDLPEPKILDRLDVILRRWSFHQAMTNCKVLLAIHISFMPNIPMGGRTSTSVSLGKPDVGSFRMMLKEVPFDGVTVMRLLQRCGLHTGIEGGVEVSTYSKAWLDTPRIDSPVSISTALEVTPRVPCTHTVRVQRAPSL